MDIMETTTATTEPRAEIEETTPDVVEETSAYDFMLVQSDFY